jgi:sortase A
MRGVCALCLLALLLLGTFGPQVAAREAGFAADDVPAAPTVGYPVRLRIPKIGVDANVERVGLAADGAMDVPKDPDDVAWFESGVRPGEQGNAAIDGHVDSCCAPAVFWDLRKLVAGDEIIVVGDDNIERHFVVRGWETYPDTAAPLDRIFGPSFAPHLNLITCDQNSAFDRARGSYDGNLVVYADLAP